MVTKVVTDKDVDNVTIVINPQNQLESQVIIEEVAGLTMPVTLRKDGKEYPVNKVGKIAGTDWLVFQVKEKETIRIPTSVTIKQLNVKQFDSAMHTYQIAYILTPENNAEFKTGTVSSNAVLTFNFIGDLYVGEVNRATSYFSLPTDVKGESTIYASHPYDTDTSEIESVTASGNITVETEDKIYVYELVSPATVEKPVTAQPTYSFTAEMNCGDYTWTEETDDQGQYLLGTATQPATITVVPTNFTADDVFEIRLVSDYGTSAERNGLVLTVQGELYADVGATTYPIGEAIEVVFNNGTEVRQDVRLECPITK